MAEKLEGVFKVYERNCKKCGKVGLVPKGQVECLNCLRKTLNLKPWESICLQCGKKVSHLPEKHKICLDCLDKNLGNSKGKLENSLNHEQKKLWENYRTWESHYNSFIILMS